MIKHAEPPKVLLRAIAFCWARAPVVWPTAVFLLLLLLFPLLDYHRAEMNISLFKSENDPNRINWHIRTLYTGICLYSFYVCTFIYSSIFICVFGICPRCPFFDAMTPWCTITARDHRQHITQAQSKPTKAIAHHRPACGRKTLKPQNKNTSSSKRRMRF